MHGNACMHELLVVVYSFIAKPTCVCGTLVAVTQMELHTNEKELGKVLPTDTLYIPCAFAVFCYQLHPAKLHTTLHDVQKDKKEMGEIYR